VAERKQVEFYVLRYVPDAVKEEFVNIGVLMIEPGTNGSGFADVSFTKDWRRVHCLDPQADVEVLESLEREIQAHLRVGNDRAALLKRINDSFSNLIQVSPIKACLAEQPAKELAMLTRLYTESSRGGGDVRVIGGRQKILATMREAFEEVNIWGLLQHGISVVPYTKPGDPFKFDFGYRVGDTLKLFHAASLKNNVDQGIMLASRYPAIAEKMRSHEDPELRVSPLLTAIVEDGLKDGDPLMHFVNQTMKEAKITVATSSRMPEIAETARRELKA